MLKTILVAYDGSEPAERAFRFALELARAFQATIHVVAVASPPEPPTALEMAGLLESATEHFKHAFAGLRHEAQAAGVPMSTRIVAGHAAAEIVREATEQKADLVVMGRRGGSRIERWLLGSVSKRVLSYAPCSVTVVQ
ncbi:MAG TPA: universal stress protein [Phycisphaerae bacterium]|nr:universal stress protein [Phycisphaerae bacterium]